MIKLLGIVLLLAVIVIPFTGNAFAHTVDVAGDYKIEIGWTEEPPVAGIDNAIEVTITTATDADKEEAEQMRAMMNMGSGSGMNMNSASDSDRYDELLGDILSQFDMDSLNSNQALSKISKVISNENITDEFGKEIKNLIADSNSGIITSEDAMYKILDMVGISQSTTMDMSDHDQMDMNDHEHKTGPPGGIGGVNSLQISVLLDGVTKTLDLKETEFEGVYNAKFFPQSSGYPVAHIFGTILNTDVDLTMHPEEVEELSSMPPLKQMNHGIFPSDVQCKEGLELFMRLFDESAICVSSQNGQRLLELGVVDYF